MAVRLRLMRMGKKKQPTYRIVAADSRSPRDGRFLEIIGTYNPRSEPSAVKVDNVAALKWLQDGARPSEAVEKLLKISGAWESFTTGAPLPVDDDETPPPAATTTAPPTAAAPVAEPDAAPSDDGPAAEEAPAAEAPGDDGPAAEEAPAAEAPGDDGPAAGEAPAAEAPGDDGPAAGETPAAEENDEATSGGATDGEDES